MILTVFIYPHPLPQGASDSTESAMIPFPSAPSCARTTIYGPAMRLQVPIPDKIYTRLDRIMKNSLDLLLDFKEKFPHITSRIIS